MLKYATLPVVLLITLLASGTTTVRACGGGTKGSPAEGQMFLETQRRDVYTSYPYSDTVSHYETEMNGEVVEELPGATGASTSVTTTPNKITDFYSQSYLTNMRLPATWRFKANSTLLADCGGQWGGTKSIVLGGTYKYVCTVYYNGNTVDWYHPSATAFDLDGTEISVDPESRGNTLTSDQSLQVGDGLISPNGVYSLVMLESGEVVMYDGIYNIAWRSNFLGRQLYMQSDGNLVLLDGGNNPVWWTGTQGNPGAFLEIRDQGYIAVFNPWYTELWSN